tara:strand:- start:402 stop:659 length:258 start_codon:yes stop_codon:yes gene_type:complete
MAENKKEEVASLDFSAWEQQKDQNNQDLQEIGKEEASILGQQEQLTRRLEEIQRIREGLKYANATGDHVAGQAQEAFAKLSKTEK